MRQKKRVSFYVFLGILMLLFVGCSSSTPKPPAEKPYYKLDKGLEILSKEIKNIIDSGIKEGTLSSILNIAVLDIEEKATGQRLAFGVHIAEKILSNATSNMSKESASNIGFIELQMVREIVEQSENQRINSKDLAKNLNSNLMIKGHFLQEDEERLMLRIDVFDPKEGFTLKTLEVGILIDSIAKQLTQSFPRIVEKEYKVLYQQIGQAKIENISNLVHDKWNNYYTTNQRKLLIEKIAIVFAADIQNLAGDNATAGEKLGTIKKIDMEKKHSEFYLKESFLIQELEYTYTLKEDQNSRVQESLKYIDYLESLFNSGISVTFAFIAKTDDNDPLDFECDGDRELKISLGTNNFYYEEASCREEGERQVMTWLTPFNLSPKNWPIIVIEENIFGDETVKSSLSISKNEFLNIYFKNNSGVNLTGYDYYSARFTKQD